MTQFNGSADELFDLLKKEAELIFYQKKLSSTEMDLEAFLSDYRSDDRESVLKKYQIPIESRLDWSVLLNPAKGVSPQAFPNFILEYLKKISLRQS